MVSVSLQKQHPLENSVPHEATFNLGHPPFLVFGRNINKNKTPAMDGQARVAEDPHARDCLAEMRVQ